MTDFLSYQLVKADQTDPSEWVVMLHGILGQKRNLFGFARKFTQNFPHLGVILVDLRCHGQSPEFSKPHTLAACAGDLKALLSALKLNIRSIVGHSFGAGVASTYAHHFDGLKTLWLLDAVPGVITEGSDVERVLAALSGCLSVGSKQEFSECLAKSGLSQFLISWLSMNLSEANGQLIFKPSPQYASELLNDFRINFTLQLFKNLGPSLKVFMVRAERNASWRKVDKEINNLVTTGLIEVFDLPDSGHYVHMDNPAGILEMMKADFA